MGLGFDEDDVGILDDFGLDFLGDGVLLLIEEVFSGKP